MATINAKILNRVDKKGLTKVQIAVQHKGELAYIPTDIKVYPKDFANGKLISGSGKAAVNSQILALLNEYRERLEEEDNLPAINVIQLKEHLLHGKKKKFVYVSEGFSCMVEQSSKANGIIYEQAKKTFLRFNKGKDITIKSIDADLLQKYIEWLNDTKIERYDKPYAEPSKRRFFLYLKYMVNDAIKKGNVKFEVNPFDIVKCPFDNAVKENFINVDTLNILRNYTSEDKSYMMGKDVFMLSFFLGGINLVDIMQIDFSNEKISYIRQKVKGRVKNKTIISILPQARKIINRYIKEDGTLSFGHYTKLMGLHALVDRFIADVKDKNGLKQCITFYSARKCFAQIAMNIGISDNITDYILGHSSSKRGVITHYSAVMPELAEEAMKMVFEFIDKPEDIKAIFRRNILKQLNG